MASIEPTARLAMAKPNTTGFQSSARTSNPATNTRVRAANPAALTPAAIYDTTGEGAPW